MNHQTDSDIVQRWMDTRETVLEDHSGFISLLTFLSDKAILLLLDYCSAKSLVLLLRTCRTLKAAVEAYIGLRFDVNRILGRYFAAPRAFRYLQACTGTLISGSSALQFFDRSFYPSSDLDLYVSKVWGLRVGRFLFQEGYSFVPSQHQHPTFQVAIVEERVHTNTALYGNFRCLYIQEDQLQ